MRTTVDIDRHLLERLRREAREGGISFKELLNRVLQRGLDAAPRDEEPYRCPTFDMGEPLRGLDKALKVADSLADDSFAL